MSSGVQFDQYEGITQEVSPTDRLHGVSDSTLLQQRLQWAFKSQHPHHHPFWPGAERLPALTVFFHSCQRGPQGAGKKGRGCESHWTVIILDWLYLKLSIQWSFLYRNRNHSTRPRRVSGWVRSQRYSLHLVFSFSQCDVREPNVVRIAPVPLYNTFSDVHRFIQTLRAALINQWRKHSSDLCVGLGLELGNMS